MLVSEGSGSLPGPELEIFTLGYVPSYVNLMVSVIESGSVMPGGMSVKTILNGNSRSRCPPGRFQWSEGPRIKDTLHELDLLLTHRVDWVRSQRRRQPMTTEFNTLGSAAPRWAFGTGRSGRVHQQQVSSGARATFNMIVPQNCDACDDYVDIRSNIALIPDEVLQTTQRAELQYIRSAREF